MTDTTTVIKLGDRVTWENKQRRKLRPLTMPLKLTGCKVMELFDVEGEAAAKLDCGRLFGNVIAFVTDLDLEKEPERRGRETTILSGG